MVTIARNSNGDEETVSLNDVAETTHISRRYLEQLAIVLKNASLIRGKTGKGGGYRLARSPKDIRTGEIIEAAIGPINVVDCVLEPGTCDMSGECECRSVYCDINRRITETLNELTLQNLVKRENMGHKRKRTRVKKKA
jgi:Rrf2 family protein